MTLSSITTEKNIPLGGGVRMIIYRAVDDGSGGTILAGVNHIITASVTDLTRAVWVSATWTEDSETITIRRY